MRVYLETFGCQMNELDSELVRGQLEALGYRFVAEDRDADVVLYNTCSVREQAENKALSRIGLIGKRKRAGASVILGVIGCMAERDGIDMLRRHPQIDLLCGPGELDKLPLLIDNAARTTRAAERDGPAGAGSRDLAEVVALQGNRNRRSSTLAAASDDLELLDLARAFDPERAAAGGRAAYVRITRGCNKFCTYCVVPQTRGAEVHRPPDHIVEECRRLADAGVVEVTLLGQTVNHYLYVHGTAVSVDGRELAQIGPGAAAFRGPGAVAAGRRTTTFADLLRRIHEEVPAIARLRFVTSYPRDFGDDILEVMAASPRICRYLHIPPQSGSNRILRLMNRGYTVEEYFEFVERARARLPDVGLSGDIIVGFPTEQEEDFEATAALLRRARFKNCFIFKYSPRPGTAAIDRFADDVPDTVKRRRNNELLAIQAEIGAAVNQESVGRRVDVFVEQVSERQSKADRRRAGGAERGVGAVDLTVRGRPSASARGSFDDRGDPSDSVGTIQMTGRTSADLIVAFEIPAESSPAEWLGRIVPVRINAASQLTLQGTLDLAHGGFDSGNGGEPPRPAVPEDGARHADRERASAARADS
ncbi:MAG TPA: MiaB/RimO family radical SAM methylthiotransferase [Phycisphaerales bacterium]|nr:MiaB/RimO family radical SAM methylthiotransferase [Phycisphaerales bacterium]HMP37571.1 MiaB/RimO family radical SAM methylthiotransferase [Phycisphaerales bacterium]